MIDNDGMKRKSVHAIFFALTLLISTTNSFAEIYMVESMQQVQSMVEQTLERHVASDVLVAFDIDMTLTQPDHPALYYPAMMKYSTDFKEILSELNPAQRDLIITLCTQYPQILVDETHPEIVRNVQKMGFKTIALTATVTGNIKDKYGTVLRVVQSRYDMLDKFNINFSGSYSIDEVTFSDMPSHNGNHPVFYRGILFANGEKDETGKTQKTGKGSVLISFLKHVQINPKTIVMVDDRKSNLVDIENHLSMHNPDIHFIGIEFGGAFNYAPKNITSEEFRMFWQALADTAKTFIE